MGSVIEVEQGASKQRGLISRDVARAAGMSTSAIFRRVQSGRWLTVHPGVYRVAGVPESWEQAVLAMCLWTGGVASHETAAALWGLGKPPRRIDVLVDRGTSVAHERLRLHSSVALSAADRGLRDGIPVTNLPRTLIDLASVLEDEPLEVALHEAMRVHRLSTGWLRRRLEALQPGRAGTERLRAMLRARDPRARPEEQSWLESRLKVFLRRRGFPPPLLSAPRRRGESSLRRLRLRLPGPEAGARGRRVSLPLRPLRLEPRPQANGRPRLDRVARAPGHGRGLRPARAARRAAP